MKRSNPRSFFLQACLAVVLLAVGELALAAAGKVLFVSGSVSVERNGTRALNKGDAIEVGDVIVTGDKARAQILMADGAKIALRAGTRFRIDEFTMPPAVTAPAQATVVAANGKSVASLLKGGFRTQTGTIGRTDRAAYEVRTPIGTLGIRGTDYTAVFCVGDCSDAPGLQPGETIRDGLYLGVTSGGIEFRGGGRQIALNSGQYAFIPLSGARPEPIQVPPAFLEEDGAGPLTIGAGGGSGAGTPRSAGDGQSEGEPSKASSAQLGDINDRRSPSDAGDREGADEQKGQDIEQPVTGTGPNGQPADLTDGALPSRRQNLSFSTGPLGQNPAFDAPARDVETTRSTDAAGNLTGFGGPLETGQASIQAQYAIGTSANTNVGSDAATGLRWGRWTTGAASVTANGTTINPSLAAQSLHWIVGDFEQFDLTLPITGSATYTLVGATAPTDTLGNAGVLGGAFLAADFTNATVTSTLSLDVNQVNWFATGTAPLSGTNLFSGNFSTVTVGGLVPGSGSFSGFFEDTGTAAGTPPGAVGLAYSLAASQGNLGSVSGVAALAQGTGTPPTPPTLRRDAALAIGNLGNSNGVDGAFAHTQAELLVDAGGNATQLLAPLTRGGATGTIAIGTSANVNTGLHTPTGIRWGRWNTGNANVTPPVGAPFTQQLVGQSLHWIAGPAYASAPVLPTTGTASYTLVGATSPTDTGANVGTLGNASFSADFTNRTVASALNVTIDGRAWFAGGTGTFAAGSNRFAGNYTNVQIGGLIPGAGTFSGFFVQPALGGAATAGAGLTYDLQDSLAQLGIVSGALVFQQGGGGPVGPPALAQRDIAYGVLLLPQLPSSIAVIQTPAAGYALSAFDLTRFTGDLPFDPPQPGSFDIGTSTNTDQGSDAITMMRWGRWSGGIATVTPESAPTFTVDLAQQSIHWLQSADTANPPVIPTTGTANYTLVGFTSPTDTQGNVGTLGNATFAADFANQTVTSSLNLTVNAFTFAVSCTGTIGAPGLANHHFAGLYDVGNATGSFEGFFTAPGSTVPGVPGGAGLTYALQDGQGVFNAVGVVVFRGP